MIRAARASAGSIVVVLAVTVLAACTSTSHHSVSAPVTPPPGPSSTEPSAATSDSPTATPTPASSTPTATPTSASSAPPVPGSGPIIVIDPGHSPSIKSVDPATGLIDSDYENEPEMRDVFAVALLVRTQLEAAGYRVVMTKSSVTARVPLGQRAAIANNAHAALALSIHDQAGANGGIQFRQGNNIVYYQSVGGYRATPAGTHITFTDSAVAALSKRYGQIFQADRASAQGASIRLQGNVGYNLGTRGLPAGDMWMVQLLSKVPWIYNEAGGNSAGMVGLSASDEQKYAAGLVAAVEQCVPIG